MSLVAALEERFAGLLLSVSESNIGEVTIEVGPKNYRSVCSVLKTAEQFAFAQLIDLCGIDYLHYGSAEWTTQAATAQGFSRGAHDTTMNTQKPRFAVVLHLLSLKHKMRLRVRTYPDLQTLLLDSVVDVWNCANWYEREAYDLFGILFSDHPDLRRILTDYGFVGHPFRKDFPVEGKVGVRYDAKQGRVIYEPVDIPSRVLVPKVIRKANDAKETSGV